MRFSIASAVAFAAPLALAADSLNYTGAAAGQVIKDGVELRILPVGDSVTVGYLSTDGNGYRLKLQENLSGELFALHSLTRAVSNISQLMTSSSPELNPLAT